MCGAVLIVSSAFLFRSNKARDILLPLVQNSTLPLLPILIETGLEDTFNTRIGNIQCLCPYAENLDATTVPYKEKLGNYLAKLLLTDIDINAMRNAFDASIFLSYRKRDRGVAQKLIRLIHEDPSCQGIAVWYDEFLTPGEDFNQNLKSEIEESDLFILTVTPFMLEGDNYVKITEYPLACSLGKSILPFMMEETDQGRLNDDFPGICATISATDASAVRQAILNALTALGLSPIQSTAQNQYLKGIAYLKGICVEKNTQIALSLIEAAAKDGFAQAMERLSLMYKDGDGVPRNTDIAAAWQQKLLDSLGASFHASLDAASFELYIQALSGMAEIQIESGNYDSAHDFYMQINLFCVENAIGEELHRLEVRAGAFERSGKALMKAGRYWDAWQQCFNNALALRKMILEKDDSIVARLAVIEAFGFIAGCAEQNDSVVAVKEQIVFIKNALDELDEDELFQKGEAVFQRYVSACNLLSHLYNYMIPLNAALTWNLWDKAMDRIMKNKLLLDRLKKTYPSRTADLMMLRTLINEGDIHADKKVSNHQDAAFECYRQARLLFDEIYTENFHELDAYMILAELDIKAARIFRYKKNFEIVSKIYESSLRYLRGMLEESGVPSLKRTLYDCCVDAADFMIEINDTESARALLEEAEALIEHKGEYELEHADFKVNPLIPHPARAKALGLLGSIAQSEWDIDSAIDYLTQKHEVIATYARIMKRVIDYKALVASYKNLISLHKMAGNFEEARTLEERLARLFSRFPNLNN